jgi:hypothetical protein
VNKHVAWGCLLGGGAFVMASVAIGLLVLLIAPARWKTTARVVVDWNQMPIEATGDERGLVGSVMKSLMNGDSRQLKASLVRNEELQLRTGASEVELEQLLRVVSRTDSDGTKLTVDLSASSRDVERSARVVKAAAESTAKVFRNYRQLEGFGQLMSKGRELEGTADEGLIWLHLLSVGLARPVSIEVDGTPQQDWSSTLAAGMLLGAIAGAMAAACVIAGYALFINVRRKRATRVAVAS